MPNTGMTVEQFAQKVKEKYPQYANVPDAELGQKILEKYPQYQRALSTATPASQTPAQVAQQPEGPKGLAGFASGFGKTIIDAPRQFAESGAKIGEAISDSAPGKLFGELVTKPLVGLLSPEQRGKLQQNVSDVKRVQDVGIIQNEALKRRTGAEKAGEVGADIAMALLPGGAASKGAKVLENTAALSRLGRFAAPAARGLAEAASGAAITAGQTGDLKQAALGGIFQGGISGGLEAAGVGLKGYLAGKSLKLPGAGVVPEIEQAANRVGVKLPAGALTTSKPGQLLESFAAKGTAGSPFARTVEAATAKLEQATNKLVSEAGPVASKTEAGQIVKEGLESFKKEFQATKNALYKKANLGSINATIAPKETHQLITDVVTRLKRAQKIGADVPELAFWEKKLAGLTNKDGSVRNIRINDAVELLKDINNRTKFGDLIAVGDKASVKRLGATLSREVDDGLAAVRPDLKAALDKANALYSRGMEFVDTKAAQTAQRLAKTPDKIFEAIVSPSTSVEDVKRFMTLAGDEADTIRATFLDDLINQSSRDEGVRGSLIESALRKYGPDKLEAILKPEQVQALEDIATVSKALKAGQKIAEGSQTAFLQRMMLTASSIFVNPLIALKLLASDYAIGKIMFSDSGRKLMLRGLELAPIGENIAKQTAKKAPFLGRLTSGSLGAMNAQR